MAAEASSSQLPKSVYDSRRHVGIHKERVSNVSSTDYPGHYPGEDHSWNLQKFKKKLQVKVQRLSTRSIEFDLVGVDASIANAFRRILIAEVPTIAIEHVYIWNNTSVIHDEVLAHRIGLVPLNVDPEFQEFRTSSGINATPNDRNTVVFKLSVACERNPKAPKGSIGQYINEYVKSGDLVWEPQGEQRSIFEVDPAPTNKDIVLAKLRPGQEVEMELHAIKGVGKEHAKWSPVATASYRLHPLIILNPDKPVPRYLATKFAECFSPGVVKVSIDERNMRKDSVSREVLRHPEFEGCVELKRIRDWFIFNIESEGAYTPERLLPESIKVMRAKIASIRKAAEALLTGGDGEGASADGDVEMGDA
ncbi:insert subdomain of RNA polymerase alpha subunit [Cristinia sonorae]|uniref:DNA-directed RNA polymerases I and III subunit RPAC1 n=1 Tax=Cristinia sonorae TaxID=1940300 RepID=A0A8K0UGC7_9AGAR|nr:insert subdomain of RNA polymerase alpha subunit [Cristinia sonorae]